MAKLYNYYYIGDKINKKSSLNGQSPVLLSMSKVKNGQKGETLPHSHRYVELFYFIKGSGYVLCENSEKRVCKNTLAVVNAGSIHQQYSEKEDPLVYYSILIDNVKIDDLPANCLLPGKAFMFTFDDSKNAFYKNIIELTKELKGQYEGYYLKIKGLLSVLVAEAVRLKTKSERELGSRHIPDYVTETKDYIEKNYSLDVSLNELANAAFTSKTNLIHQFKKFYNVSPIKFLNLTRLEHAKELLNSTNDSIVEIAMKTGFSNPVYFSEIFKKEIGTTPSTFRNMSEHLKSENKSD